MSGFTPSRDPQNDRCADAGPSPRSPDNKRFEIIGYRLAGLGPRRIAAILDVTPGVVAGVLFRASMTGEDLGASYRRYLASLPRLGVARGERVNTAKLTEAAVRLIRHRRAQGAKGVALAREFGVTQSVICRVCRGTAWRHVTDGAQRQDGPVNDPGMNTQSDVKP